MKKIKHLMISIRGYTLTALFAGCLICLGCTPDRVDDFIPKNPETTPNGVEIVPGIIMINEFSATGTDTANQLTGKKEEWIEIYNNSDDTLILEQGKWFLTDHGWDNPDRFEIPEELTLPPESFFLFWCDNEDRSVIIPGGHFSIHTNFSLNSDGEDIGIYYKQEDGRMLQIDRYPYGPQRDGISEGRKPDGENNWHFFENPTPGSSNNN